MSVKFLSRSDSPYSPVSPPTPVSQTQTFDKPSVIVAPPSAVVQRYWTQCQGHSDTVTEDFSDTSTTANDLISGRSSNMQKQIQDKMQVERILHHWLLDYDHSHMGDVFHAF